MSFLEILTLFSNWKLEKESYPNFLSLIGALILFRGGATAVTCGLFGIAVELAVIKKNVIFISVQLFQVVCLLFLRPPPPPPSPPSAEERSLHSPHC